MRAPLSPERNAGWFLPCKAVILSEDEKYVHAVLHTWEGVFLSLTYCDFGSRIHGIACGTPVL